VSSSTRRKKLKVLLIKNSISGNGCRSDSIRASELLTSFPPQLSPELPGKLRPKLLTEFSGEFPIKLPRKLPGKYSRKLKLPIDLRTELPRQLAAAATLRRDKSAIRRRPGSANRTSTPPNPEHQGKNHTHQIREIQQKVLSIIF
jgi:hypothetical protein